MSCVPNDTALPLCPDASASGGEDMTALRAPGRPKDLEKREAILDAALTLFAERGLDGVPIEAIAARSGVSKVTVYNNFGDKASIFDCIVQRETDRLSRELGNATGDGGSLEDRLTRFGRALVTMLTQPCHLALDRSVAMEAQRNPTMGKRFFDAGPGRVHGLLTDILAGAAAAGDIAVDNPAQAAQDLLSLWLGYQALERRLCGGCVPDEAELQKRINHSVRLFLRASRP